MIYRSIILLIYFSTSISAHAQQSTFSNSQSEFDLYFDKAELAYKSGNYFRAKNLYTYCSKMNHPRTSEAIKKKDLALNLALNQTTAERYISEGKTLDAQKVYASIARSNPSDLKTQNILKNLDKFVAYKSPPSEKKVKPAITKPKPLTSEQRSIAVSLEKEREILKRKSSEQQLFESTYAQGINALKACNYLEALNHFKKAHGMRPGASKTKRYFYDLQALITINKRIEDFKMSTNFSPEEILQTYQEVQKINANFELIQSQSSCLNTEKDACKYIWAELPVQATKYNCQQIISFAERLSHCPTSSENQERLEYLVNSCQSINDKCKIANQLIAERIKESNRLQSQGFYEASNSSYKSIIEELEKLKSECNGFNPAIFEDDILGAISNNDKNLRNESCKEEQQKVFETAENESDSFNGRYKEALDLLATIDTTCIDISFSSKLRSEKKRIMLIYKKQQMAFFEQKAVRSSSLNFFVDAGIFLRNALEFAELDTDINRINKSIELNDCYDKYQGKPCPTPILGIIKQKECKDTTSEKQTPLQIIVGLNSSSLNASWLEPDVYFPNYFKTGTYKVMPFFGVRLNHQSFIRPVDFNVALQYTPPNELSFLNLSNDNSDKLKFHSIDFDFNLKLHRLHNCRDKGRTYVFVGGNLGYKNLKNSEVVSTLTQETINSNYKNVIVAGFQAGLGYEFPKDRLSIEFEYKRQGMLNNNKESKSQFQNPNFSLFSIGYLRFKLGYNITK